jgi:hypothetical protein
MAKKRRYAVTIARICLLQLFIASLLAAGVASERYAKARRKSISALRDHGIAIYLEDPSHPESRWGIHHSLRAAISGKEGVSPIFAAIIDCKGERLPEPAWRELRKASDVQMVGIMNAKEISDDNIKVVQSWKELKTLSLSGSHFSGSALDQLLDIKSLRFLSLDNTEIDNSDVDVLCKMKQLRQLRLFGTNISQDELQRIEAQLPNTTLYY